MHKILSKFKKSRIFWSFAPQCPQELCLWTKLEDFRSSESTFICPPSFPISKYATACYTCRPTCKDCPLKYRTFQVYDISGIRYNGKTHSSPQIPVLLDSILKERYAYQ